MFYRLFWSWFSNIMGHGGHMRRNPKDPHSRCGVCRLGARRLAPSHPTRHDGYVMAYRPSLGASTHARQLPTVGMQDITNACVARRDGSLRCGARRPRFPVRSPHLSECVRHGIVTYNSPPRITFNCVAGISRWYAEGIVWRIRAHDR